MSCLGRLDVVYRSLDVVKMSVLARILESTVADITHSNRSSYGECISELRSKGANLAVQNRKNTPKQSFGVSTIRTYVDSEPYFFRISTP